MTPPPPGGIQRSERENLLTKGTVGRTAQDRDEFDGGGGGRVRVRGGSSNNLWFSSGARPTEENLSGQCTGKVDGVVAAGRHRLHYYKRHKNKNSNHWDTRPLIRRRRS